MASSTKDFYDKGYGDSLIDVSLLPEEVKEFLLEEELILFSIKDSFDLLIEVGCMNGRYLEWAVAENKSYIGIDVATRFIKEGKERIVKLKLDTNYQFIEGAAENIVNLIPIEQLRNENCLLFFPFNSFGNMKDAGLVISAIKESGLPFLISSYQTTLKANRYREVYYNQCGYKGVKCKGNNKGVCFYSDDGLRTIAYHPAYIKKICKIKDLVVKSISFSIFGMMYFSVKLNVNTIKLKPE